MTALVALAVACLALSLSAAGVLALIGWSRQRRSLEQLAQSLYVNGRLEALTVQTLAAMRESARRGGGG